jgi:DNA-binding NtrC family response regulator
MTSGTKIRLLGRLLDASDCPVWVIGPEGTLVYLSAAAANWLGQDGEGLIGRRSVAGAAITDDPLDRIAASLSPPPGFSVTGTASLRVQVPTIDGIKRPPRDVRFVRVGEAASAITIAVAGTFADRLSETPRSDPSWKDAVAIRERLDTWRAHHASITTIATAGTSSAAKRLRRRLQVAAAMRTDIAFVSPPGCAAESIASRIHHLSSPGEPIAVVDGSLMDPELLDAALTPLIHRLSDSTSFKATALVRTIDEMPLDAQSRLSELHTTYGGRMRLIALCDRSATVVTKTDNDAAPAFDLQETFPRGVSQRLSETLSALHVTIEPLVQRIEDVPMLATAILDARRSAGEGVAQRFSRAALDAMIIYPWPNNFDELDAAVRQAIRASTSLSIGPEHLPLAIRSFRPGTRPSSRGAKVAADLDDAVAKFELRLIDEAIEAAQGNRAEAARRLGISRSRLLRKMEERDGATDDGD